MLISDWTLSELSLYVWFFTAKTAAPPSRTPHSSHIVQTRAPQVNISADTEDGSAKTILSSVII